MLDEILARKRSDLPCCEVRHFHPSPLSSQMHRNDL
jgi:hypothetical protein